jgi:hypothetical protein
MATEPAPLAQAAPPARLWQTTVDAWLFALPVIEMAAARARMLDPRSPGQHAGLNSFSHTVTLSSPEDHAVTTPNNDTLFSSAFIDLTKGPVTLDFPATDGRYLSVAVMDMHTDNNVVLGPLTPGGASGRWRLLGPGGVRTDARDIEVATPEAWVLARTLVCGEADLESARGLQAQLSLFGPVARQPSGYATRDQAWWRYFESAAALFAKNPPLHCAGYSSFDELRRHGRGCNFDPHGYSPTDAAVIAEAARAARRLVEGASDQLKFIDGWSYSPANLGKYGDDCMLRAVVAVVGLGALPRVEAMYLRPQGDSGTDAFEGPGPFLLRLPHALPIDGFWSLTMYRMTDDGQFFLAPNPIKRYSIGDRTHGLKRGPNGALDIFIAREDPGGDKTANWLPAPTFGRFACVLRAYLPGRELVDGRYRLPAIVMA